jgi:hypothetical protein
MFGPAVAFTFAITLLLSAGGYASSTLGKIPAHPKLRTKTVSEWYKKYGVGQQYSHKGSSLRTRDSASTNSSNNSEIPALFSEYQYYSPITVGEGPTEQSFNVRFATALTDFWLYTVGLNQSETSQRFLFTHTLYSPLNSTTAVSTGASFEAWSAISSDSGNVTGNVFQDTVTVDGITVKN